MVSDRMNVNSAESDKHECGDNENIKPLESSSPSTSEKSTKLSACADQSSDSSTKDDTIVQSTTLDKTYDKINTNDISNSEDVNQHTGDINDSDLLKDESSLELVNSQDFKENEEFDPAAWLYRTYVNISSQLDSSRIFIVEPDSIMGNSPTEESLLYENMDDCWILKTRNYLADYQAVRGIPRDEYNFCTLMKLMGHASGHSLQALYHFILNIIPVLEIFLHISRFILDKVIGIKNAKDTQQMFINSLIFAIELIIIYVCINIIFGYIVSPVIRIPFGIIGKMLLYT